jgi:hypothetical protein
VRRFRVAYSDIDSGGIAERVDCGIRSRDPD